MTLICLSSNLLAFDIIEYGKDLTSIESRLKVASKDVPRISTLADEFNESSSLFARNLISKFANQKNFIGADLYSMKLTVILNQKICRAMIDLSINSDHQSLSQTAAKVVLLNQAQVFFQEFYHSHRQVRQMLKASLKSIVLEDHTHKWRQEVAIINKLARDNAFFRSLDSLESSDNDLLLKLIDSKKIDQQDLNFSNHVFVDSFFGAVNGTIGYTNSVLARLSGNKRLRNGHLHNNPTALKILQKTLRPLDIMMLSSPFVLAGMAIPGHYDHGAIYLGTKEQLEDIGMWDHPSIIPYQKEILRGKVILDNTIKGVHLSSFDRFLYTDEILVMRRDGALDDPSKVYSQIKIGMEQIGKEYNHTYDILKLDKLLFTELIYLIYNTDEFPTRKRMGHLTIYPSDIVKILFQENTPFKMVIDIEGTRKKEVRLLSFETLPKRLRKYL